MSFCVVQMVGLCIEMSIWVILGDSPSRVASDEEMIGKNSFKARKKSKNRILSQENRYFDLFYPRLKNFGSLHLSNGFCLMKNCESCQCL